MSNGVSIEFNGDGQPEWNVRRMRVVEEVASLDAADMTGGAGQFDVTIDERPDRDATDIRKAAVTLEHHGATTQGVVLSANDNGATLVISANGPFIPLNVNKVIPPYSGTLGGFFDMVLALCEVTGSTEAEITARPVVIPGGRFNVLDRLKEIQHAQQVEMVEDDAGAPLLRRPRQEEFKLHSIAHGPISRVIDDGDLAKWIEVSYYSPAQVTNGLVYPVGGWTDEIPVYTVEAGETIEVEIEQDISISSIKQPKCIDSVGIEYSGTDSVYCVAGNDGFIIPPQQWKDGGGKVEVEIGEDTRSIIVRITSSVNVQYAPYRIAMPSGENEGYSSLRLIGSGVKYEQKTIRMPASTDPDVQTEVGASIENECLETWNQAFQVGLRTSQRYSGPKKTISFTTVPEAGVRRGMRFRYRDAYYRVRSVDRELGSARVNAEADTSIADFNSEWEGKAAQWDTHWLGKTFHDIKARPLSAPDA
jgi:hypothetical protein